MACMFCVQKVANSVEWYLHQHGSYLFFEMILIKFSAVFGDVIIKLLRSARTLQNMFLKNSKCAHKNFILGNFGRGALVFVSVNNINGSASKEIKKYVYLFCRLATV